MLRLSNPSKSIKPLAKNIRTFTNDLSINPRTRAPAIGFGPGGRSSVTGHVVTVFGCTGFLGRYLVSKLAKAGTQVIIPYRDEDEKRHLKLMGDLGQIVPLEWSLKYTPSIEECVRHSDVVYNLVGREYETKNFSYKDVNVDAARLIAQISRDSPRVARFVQVSHLNASTESESEFYRTKALGEQAVLEEFPEATIVRPGPMYGHEDKLLNSMAFYPRLWTLNDAATRIRPVHVLDVAQALTNLTLAPPPNHLGTTYNLPGPTLHTYASLLNLISYVTYNSPVSGPSIPRPLLEFASKIAQYAWWPLLSPDEITRRYINDIGTANAAEVRTARRQGKSILSDEWKGDWDTFGITPEEVENVAIIYLRRYRSAANFSRPVLLPPSRGTPAYHVLE